MGNPDRHRSARELEFIEQLQRIVKRLPGVEQGVDGFGHTTFKVGRKSLVLIGAGENGGGSLNIKADPTTQAELIKRGPYVRTPYIGQHGWVTLWGDAAVDWEQVAELVEDAYRLCAPRKLLAQFERD